jgi:disulfide bond formation protein DsbB
MMRVAAHSDRNLALAIAGAGAATILGAYFFQYVLKLPPCPLCLDQRVPYYIAIPLALVVAFGAAVGAPAWRVRLGFVLLAAAMLVGAGLGVYHAGIEWKLWAGPSSCSGELPALSTDLLRQIQTTSVVRCDEAPWRLFGLSLAGYNALISAVLAGVAGAGALRSSGGGKRVIQT